jgi:hypothetical protein
MSLTRETGTRSDDAGASATSAAIEPGKQSRSSALAIQRKASPPPAIGTEPMMRVEPGEDPFALHLPVQRKAEGQASGDAPTSPVGGGSALPSGVQARMESSFGADFGDVRVHEGPQAEQMGALAYAQGTDLHFAPGQYNPGTSAGDSLLGHELAHVQQQRAGRVATPQGKGAPIVADHALEAEADAAGDRAARGEAAGIGGGSGSVGGGAIQRKDPPATPAAHAPVAEHGPDTFNLKHYLEKLEQKTGVSGGMGKYAEAKLGVTSPPIPQLGGGALKIEGEGRYMTSGEGNELELSLHVGVTWKIDLRIFKADVQVFGEGKIKLKAKTGEMLECLNAAVKGVLFDALKMMTVRNCAGLAGPLASRAADWMLSDSILDSDVFSAMKWLAQPHRGVPGSVREGAETTVKALTKFFGEHKGSYEVSMAVGVSGDAGNDELSGGVSGKAVHGISGDAGDKVSGETRRNEIAVEGHVKKGENEGKVGYVFGGGRNVISIDAAFVLDNKFDFDKAKIVSVSGVMKLLAAAGLGTAAGHAHSAPSGGAMVNALVAGLASGASLIGNHHLEALKKQYKLSVEIEREGDHPWSSAKVDAKLFLGNMVGGKGDGGKLGEVEASAAVGTFISITREVKDHLPGAGAPAHPGGH